MYVLVSVGSVSRQSSTSKITPLPSSLQRNSPITIPAPEASSNPNTPQGSLLADEDENENLLNDGGPTLDDAPFDCTVVDHERYVDSLAVYIRLTGYPCL